MTRRTKVLVGNTVWGATSAAGMYWAADMLDRGVHHNFAEAVMTVNGLQFACALLLTFLTALGVFD